MCQPSNGLGRLRSDDMPTAASGSSSCTSRTSRSGPVTHFQGARQANPLPLGRTPTAFRRTLAMTTETDTIIIGAGPAGLAVGAALRRANVPFTVIECAQRIGESWHRHY